MGTGFPQKMRHIKTGARGAGFRKWDFVLPQDGFPLYGTVANGNPQNASAQKKKPFFLGLSVSKPLN